MISYNIFKQLKDKSVKLFNAFTMLIIFKLKFLCILQYYFYILCFKMLALTKSLLLLFLQKNFSTGSKILNRILGYLLKNYFDP